jgi:tetratricopeptide (TPR) repeat protein
MSQSLHPIRAFLAELKRRQVFKIAAVYGATGFVVVEAADLALTRLGLPDWTVTLVLMLTLLGFPIALVVAWAFDLTPEGMKRTEPAVSGELEAIVAEPRRGRWPLGAAAVVGVALLLGAVWYAGGREWFDGTREASGLTHAVAVAPFSVQAGSDLMYLEGGMVTLLSTKLDGAGDLRSVDPRALLRFVESEGLPPGDPDAGLAVAERFGADLYVVGDLVEAGGTIQLAAALYDRSAGQEAVGQGAVEGDAGALFDLVDDLAAQLLSGMSGGPAARVRRIAAVTTSSLPALKSFFEGEELFRRAQFGAAVESFRRAAEEDSLFALAHYRLSLAAEWNLQDDLARQAAEQAVRNLQRLPDRDRRLLEAFLVRRRGANAEAEQHYRSILGTYPDEMEAWLDLSEILFHANPLRGQSFTDSRETLERVLFFDPRHSTALIHLSRVAAYEEDFVGLDSLVEHFMVLNPEPERTLEIEALHAFAIRDERGMAATLARLEGAEELGVALAVWAASVYARNLDGAQRIASLATAPHRSPESRRLGYAWLAYLSLAQGRLADAQTRLAELEQLSEGISLEYRALLAGIPGVPIDRSERDALIERLERLQPDQLAISDNPSVVFTAHDRLHELIRLYLLGVTHARLGENEPARRYAGELSAVALPRTAGSLGVDLGGRRIIKKLISDGRGAEALAELEQAKMDTWYGQTMASPLYCQVSERFVRAELLRSLGRLPEALEWYASLVETSPFELPYLAIAHLRRAEIYDELDQPDRAAEHYARFVELWSDADPELQPQVAAARARLEELSATNVSRNDNDNEKQEE